LKDGGATTRGLGVAPTYEGLPGFGAHPRSRRSGRGLQESPSKVAGPRGDGVGLPGPLPRRRRGPNERGGPSASANAARWRRCADPCPEDRQATRRLGHSRWRVQKGRAREIVGRSRFPPPARRTQPLAGRRLMPDGGAFTAKRRSGRGGGTEQTPLSPHSRFGPGASHAGRSDSGFKLLDKLRGSRAADIPPKRQQTGPTTPVEVSRLQGQIDWVPGDDRRVAPPRAGVAGRSATRS